MPRFEDMVGRVSGSGPSQVATPSGISDVAETPEVAMVATLARLTRNSDAFMVAYDLAGRTIPVSLTVLAREYRADPIVIRECLDLLHRLNVVTKRGQAFVVTSRARQGFAVLDSAYRDAPRDAASAAAETESISMGLTGITMASTNNGTITAIKGFTLITRDDARRVEHQSQTASGDQPSQEVTVAQGEASDEAHAGPSAYADL